MTRRAVGAIRGALIASALATAVLFVVPSAAPASGAHPFTPPNGAAVNPELTNSRIRMNTLSGAKYIICDRIRLNGSTTNGTGAVLFPANSTTFDRCRDGAGVAVAVAQPVAWTGQMRTLPNGVPEVNRVTLDMTMPGGGLTASVPGCNLSFSGSPLGAFAVVPPQPPANQIVVTSIRFPAFLDTDPLDLVVVSAIGLTCAPLGLAAGQVGSLEGDAVFSPYVVGRGI